MENYKSERTIFRIGSCRGDEKIFTKVEEDTKLKALRKFLITKNYTDVFVNSLLNVDTIIEMLLDDAVIVTIIEY